MLRLLFYKLPPKLRFVVRYALFLPIDLVNSFFKKNNQLVPPKRLIFIGSGDFIQIGKLFQNDFVSNNIIHPDSFILDVGCGIGRSAIPLTNFLIGGKYEGFDIIKAGINWCNNNITKKYPNFNFKLVDLSNDLYKNSGDLAQDFTFPYEDNSFDLVIVLSVFTHMVEVEVERYFSEISRVLKVGGHCYATFFILNDSSIKSMQLKSNTFNFKYENGNYSLLSKKVQSANVAYKEDYLIDSIIPRNNFILKSLQYGSWSSDITANPIGFQDRMILQKIK